MLFRHRQLPFSSLGRVRAVLERRNVMISRYRRRPSSAAIVSGVFAEVLPVYLDCDPQTQALVRRLAAVAGDPGASEAERQQARASIADALFPDRREEAEGIDLEEYERQLAAAAPDVEARLDQEEATFAERLAALLKERSMSQAELATAVGVGQSAISMMLARSCRPQRRTVEKIAKALQVGPEDLWP
jgi:lambda repressor-like predicted transcriptional regulator